MTMDLADPVTFARSYRDHALSVYAAALRVTQDAAQAKLREALGREGDMLVAPAA